MPIIAELLHIQAVFVDEVRLVDSAGTVNAKALGYIYGLGKGTFVAKRRGQAARTKAAGERQELGCVQGVRADARPEPLCV
jgi:hypothetical protein